MKHFLLLILLFFSTFSAFGQNLLKSRKSSFYTYLYQIKDAEAKLFLKEKDKIWENHQIFHTLIDFFSNEKPYRKELPLGHYLFVEAQEQQLYCELESVVPWSMELLNNQTDFALAVARLCPVMSIQRHLARFFAQKHSYFLVFFVPA